jgi:hypothetical protein
MLNWRSGCCVVLLCASAVTACGGGDTENGGSGSGGSNGDACPTVDALEANPTEIPPGQLTSTITVRASDPVTERPVATMLRSPDGTFDDPTAQSTTFTCDPYAEGPVDVCVDAQVEEGSAGEPCVTAECIDVTCPENQCPIIERFQAVRGTAPGELGTATIFVEVRDPDGRPEGLSLALWAEAGTFKDPSSFESKYWCDLARHGEPIDICLLVSDGDESCDQTACIEVECNICPTLNAFNAIPSAIPDPNKMLVQWRGADADEGPQPLTAQFTSASGSFDDPTAMDSVFTCDKSGPVEMCVEIADGICAKSRCMAVLCPDP